MTLATPGSAPPPALIGYAVLRANFNYNAPSYIDNFSTYVLDVVARCAPAPVAEGEVAERVRHDYGLNIPDRVVGRLLNRAVNKHQLTRVAGGRFVLADGEIAKVPDLTADVERFQQQARALAGKFMDFVSTVLPEYLSLVEDAPDEHLQRFVEANAVPLLSRALRGARGRPAVDDAERVKGPEFLVNAFIDHISSADAAAFGYVVDLVKGAILTAVVELGTGSLERKLDDLTLILDTPVLLKALGYQGEVQQRAVEQTMALAERDGARLACFPHTIKELDGVLDSVVPVLRSRGARTGALRDVDAHFIDVGATPADLEVERGRLRERLRALHVNETNPPDTHYEFGLDEGRLDDLLQSEVGYRSAGTRRYDVDSLSAIHRMRRGGSGGGFEGCRYVLVTDNFDLAKASRKVDERHDWPLAMLDRDLAALLWVRTPAVDDDLPRAQLLATVYSGMQPGGHLWAKYLEEIEKLEARGDVSQEEAIVLRARPEARAALMQQTLGEDVSEAEVKEVVERVRAAWQAPYETETSAAHAAREAAVEAATKMRSQRDEAIAALSQARSEQAALQAQIGTLNQRFDDQDRAIRTNAERSARVGVSSIVYAIGVLLVGLAVIGLVGPKWFPSLPARFSTLGIVAGAVVFALGAWRSFAGGSARDWAKHVERPLAQKLERRGRRRAGLPEL